jgi:amino acid adenylation domain-containing protein
MVAVVLHELIEAQAKRTPDAPALVYETQKLTYAELDRRATRLAQSLAARGVGPDVTVGLHVERSLEMVIGILAILKAGGAYVPIDTGFPAERVAYMVSDSHARLVLTKESFGVPDGEKATPMRAEPHHLAYVIYTSGSTGKPKGVGIEHRNIVNYVLGVSERFGFQPGMQHAIISTIAADLGNTVLFPALATGGTLHVIAQERAENGALLAEYFEREKIDVLKIVPSHFAALDPERVMPRRRLILGGEASRLDWVAKLRAIAPRIAPDVEIHNHYGPTETTVGVLTYKVGAELPVTPSGNLPLGKPLPGSEIRLEDGELCIGGAGVARGYLNRPELTAEKFAGGFYRTGDRARLLPDGNYEFCGRVDHQVKVHGYRVELGEIESALRERVTDAVVLLREEQLVAYVTGGERTALRELLKGRLPPYMVPSTFVFLDKLPLNANGKIDRQALAALPIEAPAPAQRAGAPRTETEKTVAAIWAELLRVEHVGVDDDVFDLGAQSLMAMKALARIRDAFQVNLSLRNLFEHPTVAGLASAIEGLGWVAKRQMQGEREEITL